ncbi:ankyrin repeat domain-containing protein [Rhodoferax sp. AJA081-3]|uniref:ankyrin repeat domain-containing protein n=1 Tax=Rhodoferax sp. AJA081-3 TaxID=2752316 RepID=UPI001AE08FC0|nr:ankyrin repeat domain-containing protein [Rhodoferax sp. AJA081-3]QTN29780.1 ankyrin repeat domain-containing protein [Rhodoferax sp. AJA081-3]
MTKSERSQTRTRAGKGAEALTVFAIVWDTIVLKLMVPTGDIPFWFKALFVLAGVGVTWGALYLWRQRLKGGGARLKLSQDPVPHGVPVTVEFQIDRSITANQWQVEAKLESSARNQSGFGLVWSQDYPARAVDAHHIRAEVTLPSDMPSTAASDRDMAYSMTLTLRADGVEWTFDLKTRKARESELQFAPRDTRNLGNKKPTYTPEQVAAIRKRWAPWGWGLIALALVAQFSFFLDLNVWTRAKALIGAGAETTGVDTEAFDIRVTNYLVNDWALRGRLVGKAHVAQGVLIVQVESLDVQPVGACEADSRVCEVESVSLLLSQDGEKNFSTLAQSGSIAVNANLREVTRWSLPPQKKGVEIRMPLPAAVETHGVRLKLQIRSAGGSTVYPEHGPYLNLHRALAKARGASDPCEQVKGELELVRAGCGERLRGAAIQDKDGLLLEALKTENFDTATLLLAAGARADAHSAEDAGRTALGYAAASNDVAMVERLLATGANVNARKTNEQGQIVTALTQALRTDAAAAVHRLIQAGAEPTTNDPTGWTPMHIAAYESATESIAELVRAGADINERTPAYRKQTALQTAVQFGSAATVQAFVQLGADRLLQDNQGQNACDWAKFFKRNAEIQATVCAE